MIEFICLSRTPDVAPKLAASIPLALGDLSPWNLTVIDGNRFDMFTGLNAGARQTTGEILIFAHDDIELLGNPRTMAAPLKSVMDPRVGFIGIAGTRLLDSSGCWWGAYRSQEVLKECRGMVVHAKPIDFGMQVNTWPPGGAKFGRVVVLDGVLLMCHRRTFDRLGGFDEQTYKGFHFYDVDITFRAHREGLLNLAAPILVLHHSSGDPGPEWDENREVFAKKFADFLPAREISGNWARARFAVD